MKLSSLLLLLSALPCFLLADFSSAAGRPHFLATAGGECGPDHDNTTCSDDLCCSRWGYCGSTFAYCAPGSCLDEYGTCWGSVPPPPPFTPPPPPPPYTPTADQCGPEHQQSCSSDLCCSKWGYCGSTYDYCAPGNCLIGYGTCWEYVPPPPPDSEANTDKDSLVREVNANKKPTAGISPLLATAGGECGPDHNNTTCSDDLCCSRWGYCGSTSDYCAPTNCLDEYGTCWGSVPPPPPFTPPPPPPPYTPTSDQCGPEHQQSCSSDLCCSKWGYCGSTYDYCAPGNCLIGYGTCWEYVPPPPPDSEVNADKDSLVRKVFDKMEMINKF